MIYLDYNASAVPRPAAVEGAAASGYGNPSSAHSLGVAAADAVENARASVARLIGAEPDEITFTSGGTEADNMVFAGLVERHCLGGNPWRIITTAVEHKAVLRPVEYVVAAGAGTHHRIGVDRAGRLASRAADADALLRADVVAVMLANNEIGNVYDVAAVVAGVRAANPDAWIHTDAINAAGKIPIDVRRLGVDSLALSGHKIGGIKGIGALYVRRGRALPGRRALLLGGAQEAGLRAGTENVPGIVAFGIAARHTLADLRRGEGSRLAALRLRFIAGLSGVAEPFAVLGDPDDTRRLPNTASIVFHGLAAADVVAALDRAGIAASAGSACSCQSGVPSHVLVAMRAPKEGAVRFSAGWATTEADVDHAAAVVGKVVQGLRVPTLGRRLIPCTCGYRPR